jgi:homoserine kinase
MPAPSKIPEIVVPASISNLGPAFDTLAVAVQLYVRIKIVEVQAEAPDTLETAFIECAVDGENRIASAFRHARVRVGVPTPGLKIEVRSAIPQRAGLGSSAAATIAGLKLYELVTKPMPPATMLALACQLEGHADNAAASLNGGIALSCQLADGRVMARAWRWPDVLRFVVATPDVPLATDHSRSVLPSSIGLRDAVYNLQRALLFVNALSTARYDDLREAMHDRWHQPARTPLVPGLGEALSLSHPAILGVCLCGAGPSVAALTSGPGADIRAALGELYQRLGITCKVRVLAAHQPVS